MLRHVSPSDVTTSYPWFGDPLVLHCVKRRNYWWQRRPLWSASDGAGL